MGQEPFKNIEDAYLRRGNEARTKLTALSLTVVAAIYFFPESESVDPSYLKTALAVLVFAMVLEVVGALLASQHYGRVLDEKAKKDYRSSGYGKSAEIVFWSSYPLFLLGVIIYFIGLFL